MNTTATKLMGAQMAGLVLRSLCVAAIGLAVHLKMVGPAKSETVTGHFKGRLVTEAMSDGRNLKVLEPFAFIDAKGATWTVPVGTTTDGASVPRFFWSLFPPFSGRHRLAAVVHDHYCQTRSRPWRAVHLAFYDAMIAAGVDEISAQTMYGAVFAFGPRWSMRGPSRATKTTPLKEHEQLRRFEILKVWIAKNNPTIRDVEGWINKERLRQGG